MGTYSYPSPPNVWGQELMTIPKSIIWPCGRERSTDGLSHYSRPVTKASVGIKEIPLNQDSTPDGIHRSS